MKDGPDAGAVRLRSSPREPALRKDRCYDHLAEALGVLAYQSLLELNVFNNAEEGMHLTQVGVAWFTGFGVDPDAAARHRRSFCRPCLDWGERRHHLGGRLGRRCFSG